ncbi:MAG: glutamate racemase [Candidatus Paraimprobicoccus trichonymphae]|uniref:Glutamate racemase n=1 Tax=Candidatus Paraimprobicoccus trichonymphae TaxID=3033793 RepID=A0AA48I0H8_9FIRM|nr:MAG: glutamate racemase [Candidatus Paraimprobicoccus trichonymphae]
MNNKPIGIFDSGIGGLNVVKELKKILPKENIVYFGDTARLPYGSKSPDVILGCAYESISFLRSKKVKAVVSACGTVSSLIQEAKKGFDFLFVDVLDSTCEKAINSTVNKKIGIMATVATIKSNSYKKKIKLLNDEVEVYQIGCPLLVPIIESGISNFPKYIINNIIYKYLKYLLDFNIDTLVLGCTHYPAIINNILEITKSEIKIINSSKETVVEVFEILKKNDLLSQSTNFGKYDFFASKNQKNFCLKAKKFIFES